jgi:hypothetical protein
MGMIRTMGEVGMEGEEGILAHRMIIILVRCLFKPKTQTISHSLSSRILITTIGEVDGIGNKIRARE